MSLKEKIPPLLPTVVCFYGFVLLTVLYTRLSGNEKLAGFLLREDGLFEWYGFLLLIFTAFLLFSIVPLRRRFYPSPFPGLFSGVFHLGVPAFGLLFFLGAMEEVSWFQRLLIIETPDFFESHNHQAELNLHNLMIGDISINKLLFGKILGLFMILHNIVLPLWARFKPSVVSFVEKFGFFVPPLSLGGLYVLAAISATFLPGVRIGEAVEIIGIFHYSLAVFLAYIMGVGYAYPLLGRGTSKKAGGDVSMAGGFFIAGLVFLFFLAWILSLAFARL